MLNPELKTPFRWYYSDGEDESGSPNLDLAYSRQLRFKTSASGQCYYKLYTHSNRLNPFQVFIPAQFATIPTLTVNQWFIYRCDFSPADTPDVGAFYDLTAAIGTSIESKQSYGVGVWHIYKEAVLPVTIDPGFWYSFMILADGSAVVSEIFYVPCDESEFDKFTKLEWYNSCDFSRHIYQTGYKNILYCTSELANSEPSVEEEGFNNGDGDFIQTSAIYYDNYRLEEYVPEFVMNALLAIKMHDSVFVTQPRSTYTGKVRNPETAINWEGDGFMASVSIQFQQEIDLNKSGCCENTVFSSLVPIMAVPDTLYVLPMTGGAIYFFNVKANDLGYDLHLTGVTSGASVDYSWDILDFGVVSIIKSSPIGNVTDIVIPYSIIDGFGNTSSSTVTIKFAEAEIVDDFISFPGIAIGQTLPSPVNLMANDILPIPSSGGPPPDPLYSIENTGIQEDVNGDYINISEDGSFTFTKGPLVGSVTIFTYSVINNLTGIVVGAANIQISTT